MKTVTTFLLLCSFVGTLASSSYAQLQTEGRTRFVGGRLFVNKALDDKRKVVREVVYEVSGRMVFDVFRTMDRQVGIPVGRLDMNTREITPIDYSDVRIAFGDDEKTTRNKADIVIFGVTALNKTGTWDEIKLARNSDGSPLSRWVLQKDDKGNIVNSGLHLVIDYSSHRGKEYYSHIKGSYASLEREELMVSPFSENAEFVAEKPLISKQVTDQRLPTDATRDALDGNWGGTAIWPSVIFMISFNVRAGSTEIVDLVYRIRCLEGVGEVEGPKITAPKKKKGVRS